MGGDFAPANVVAGSVDAVRRDPGGIELILVGPEALLNAELARINARDVPVSIVHASEVITMDDGATAALKQKKDSSIAVGLEPPEGGEGRRVRQRGAHRRRPVGLDADPRPRRRHREADHRGPLPEPHRRLPAASTPARTSTAGRGT